MTTVRRNLPGDLGTVIAEQQTTPFFIVKIEFPTGTGYYSESWEVDFEGNTYIEGAIRLEKFNWTGDSVQSGRIALLNENDAATALVLNNTIQETPITIYQVYRRAVGTYTTPLIYARGVLSGANISPKESVIGVLTSRAETQFVPTAYFTSEEGYSALPPSGTVVQWNGEKYVLEGQDDL